MALIGTNRNDLVDASYRRQNRTIQDMGGYSVKPELPTYQINTPNFNPVGSNYNSDTGGDVLQRLMNAIAKQESGGNYKATNPSGALGKYQIMNFNLPNWAKAAGYGYTPTAQQFLNDPQMQETIARYQFQQALAKYGDIGQVAALWYGGEGGRKAYVSGKGKNKEAGGYPSIVEYVNSILRMMGM